MLNILNFNHLINLGVLPNFGISTVLTLLTFSLIHLTQNLENKKTNLKSIMTNATFGVLFISNIYFAFAAIFSFVISLITSSQIHWF